MKFLGVDLAARPANTSVCVLEWKSQPRVEAIEMPASDERIVHLACDDVSAIGIDSPFGWPDAFVAFVSCDSRPPRPLDSTEADCLKYRATDRWLRAQRFPFGGNRIRPLSVAADKLGAVALRCVRLVEYLVAERGDRSSIYEVYPAATLACSYKSASAKTKRAASKAARTQILGRLIDHGLDVATFGDALVDVDDNLDALLSAVTAALAFAGRTEPPPAPGSVCPLRRVDPHSVRIACRSSIATTVLSLLSVHDARPSLVRPNARRSRLRSVLK